MSANNPSGKGGFSDNPKNRNTKGRPPKGYSITESFREMFSADPEKKQQIVASIFSKALEGDPTAQKLIWSYMDGAPPQTLKHSGAIGTINFDENPEALATLYKTYQAVLDQSDEEA